MRPGLRILLMLLGVFPLIAPYELLVRIDWQDYVHPFFLLAALVSAGAVAVSLFFFVAALAGISSQLVFDGTDSTFTYSFESPVVRRNSRVYPLSAVRTVEVREHTWTDGAPTYHLRVEIGDGVVIESGSSGSREEVEAIQARIERFIREWCNTEFVSHLPGAGDVRRS